jgi:hypothetical protein
MEYEEENRGAVALFHFGGNSLGSPIAAPGLRREPGE